MNNLDLARINHEAPYKVRQLKKPGYFSFVSGADVEFAVGFDSDEFLSTESYQLIIANINHRPSPRDSKVRATIFAIIEELFRVNNVTMLYICESGDGKQAMRSRLFNYWFTNFIDRGKFTMLQSSIIDREGVDNFFAIITRNDNPQAKQAISEFYDNVYFFNHKPE